MVNVNVAFPFNLHKQPSGEPPSRSVSGGTLDSTRHSRRNSLSSTHDPEGSTSRSNDTLDGGADYQKPILNVKLVTTPLSNDTSRVINGISRGRPGRRIEHGRTVVVCADHLSHLEDENVNEENDVRTPRLQTVSSVEVPDNSSDTVRSPPTNTTRDLTRAFLKDPSEPSNDDIAPSHNEDFTIRDAGAISRSWGD